MHNQMYSMDSNPHILLKEKYFIVKRNNCNRNMVNHAYNISLTCFHALRTWFFTLLFRIILYYVVCFVFTAGKTNPLRMADKKVCNKERGLM